MSATSAGGAAAPPTPPPGPPPFTEADPGTLHTTDLLVAHPKILRRDLPPPAAGSLPVLVLERQFG
jgi:hypothetical protein